MRNQDVPSCSSVGGGGDSSIFDLMAFGTGIILSCKAVDILMGYGSYGSNNKRNITTTNPSHTGFGNGTTNEPNETNPAQANKIQTTSVNKITSPKRGSADAQNNAQEKAQAQVQVQTRGQDNQSPAKEEDLYVMAPCQLVYKSFKECQFNYQYSFRLEECGQFLYALKNCASDA